MSRKPRYDVRNDGVGPYAIFYCDHCSREYRTEPDVKSTIANEVGRSALQGLLRNIPLFGSAVADGVLGPDPRHARTLDAGQLDTAWGRVSENFRECPVCKKVVCLSDYDSVSNTCNDDSPRKGQIAEAKAEQAVGVMKGLAGAFGLGDAIRGIGEAAKQATSTMARCPKDGTLAPPNNKFCPSCGGPMVLPDLCGSCGSPTMGAKFCPNCGKPSAGARAAATNCTKCGGELGGAKFCPFCGTAAGG